MPYSQTSLAAIAQALADRLGDSSHIHWSLSELYAAILEALRIFQALTGFSRERVTFQTTAGTAFYDLRSLIPSQYAFTITDNQILQEIQQHFIEPVTNPWTGTDQFTIAQIAEAVQDIRDDFLLDTGVYASRLSIAAPAPPTSRLALDPATMDIRRLGWRETGTGRTTPLHRTDEYAFNAYKVGWPSMPTVPYAYSVAVVPPITVQLFPPPVHVGSLDLIAVFSGNRLPMTTGSPQFIGLPDDLAWGVKYGAMSRLLSHDGPAYDPERAQIAEQMRQLAVTVALSPLSSLVIEITGRAMATGAIADLDMYQPNWQNTADKPQLAGFASANLFALSPVPDAIYQGTMDLARSFPVPDITNPSTSYLQVGYELLDPILDMAQWTASFKLGGEEFQAVMPLRQRFLERCGYMNQRLRANATYNQLLNQASTRQAVEVPRVMVETKG